MKTIEIFDFQPLIKNSVTTGFSFFIINHISNHIIENYNLLHFLPILYSSIFLQTSCISFEYSIKALGSLKCFNPTFSRLLTKY